MSAPFAAWRPYKFLGIGEEVGKVKDTAVEMGVAWTETQAAFEDWWNAEKDESSSTWGILMGLTLVFTVMAVAPHPGHEEEHSAAGQH